MSNFNVERLLSWIRAIVHCVEYIIDMRSYLTKSHSTLSSITQTAWNKTYPESSVSGVGVGGGGEGGIDIDIDIDIE